jgi:hypothetical protein
MKVAIIGTVPGSKRVAPYEDVSWDIWVCSPGNSQQGAPPRITEWFELHAIVDCMSEEHAKWWPAYVEWLNKQECPIWMQEPNSIVPKALTFPRDPLLARWGESKTAHRTNWFTSSIAWMMAHALHQMRPIKADGSPDVENYLPDCEIGIFGVDMAATEEHYSWQKAGCLRFIEIAEQLGVAVKIPLESTLATPAPLYGYCDASRFGRSMRVRAHEMNEKMQQLQQQGNQISHEVAFFKGAMEQIAFDMRTHVSGLLDAEIDVAAIAKAEVAQLSDAASAMSAAIVAPAAIRQTPPSAADFADNPDAKLLNGSSPHPAAIVKTRSRSKPKGRGAHL